MLGHHPLQGRPSTNIYIYIPINNSSLKQNTDLSRICTPTHPLRNDSPVRSWMFPSLRGHAQHPFVEQLIVQVHPSSITRSKEIKRTMCYIYCPTHCGCLMAMAACSPSSRHPNALDTFSCTLERGGGDRQKAPPPHTKVVASSPSSKS